MSRAERDKGARFEVATAHMLTDAGFPCTRNARNGKSTDDLAHIIPGIHIETKHQETWTLRKWLRQAEMDAAGRTPVVVFKANRTPVYACLPFAALLDYWR